MFVSQNLREQVTMKKILFVLAVAVLVAAASAVPAMADSLVYNQSWDGTGNLFASQNDTNGNGNFATTYDNFTLGTSSVLDKVTWVGGYFNPPVQGLITGYTIQFYADLGSGLGPGASLFSEHVSGNASETLISGTDYSYSLNINPFTANAGTTYWMSLVPDEGFPPQWGWATGTGGDGAAWQCFFGACGPLSSDLTFALYGNPVTTQTPEPASLLLLGSGLLGLAGGIRRRMKKA
jgi:opacity protein-like surface antigen